MTKTTFALPLSIVVLSVSSLLVTGQEPRQPRPRVVPPPQQLQPQAPSQSSATTTEQTEPLGTNYRITFSGKSDDKSLGELSTLTCARDISLLGLLNSSETSTTFSVSGTLEEKDGLLLFTYSIEFSVPVISKQASTPPPGYGAQYQRNTSKGSLKMKPGKAYELLKSGGNSYSIVIAPEVDK